MSIRRFLAIVAVTCVCLGVARGVAQALVLAATARWPAFVLGSVVITLFWLPIAAIVALSWGLRVAVIVRVILHVGIAALAVCCEAAVAHWIQPRIGFPRVPYPYVVFGRLDTNLLFY